MARGQSNRTGSRSAAAMSAPAGRRYLNAGELLDAQAAHARRWGIEFDQRAALMMMAPAEIRSIRMLRGIARAGAARAPDDLHLLTQAEIESACKRAFAGEDIGAVMVDISQRIARVAAHGPLGPPWDQARAQWHACDRLIAAIADALGAADPDHRGDGERPGELRRALVWDLQRLMDRDMGEEAPLRALDLRGLSLPGGGAPSAGLFHRLRDHTGAVERARLNDPERAEAYVQLVAGIHIHHVAPPETGHCAPVVAIARTLAIALDALDADMYRASPEQRARAWGWMNTPGPASGGLSPLLTLTRSPEQLTQITAGAAALAPDGRRERTPGESRPGGARSALSRR